VLTRVRTVAPIGVRLSASGDGGGNPIFRALGGAAKSALSELEKQAAVAAMQEPREVQTGPLIPPEQGLPDSFEDAVGLAVRGCSDALFDGSTQLIVEFDTSAGDETYNLLSRSMTFLKPFLPLYANIAAPTDDSSESAVAAAVAASGEKPPPRIMLLFPDEGTAAYVSNNWEGLPARTACMSLPRAQLIEGAEALILVAPGATEVAAVQRLLAQVNERAPTTSILLINPKLVDMQSTGYGLVGRDLRNMVSDTFTVPFALKSYPDGALFRTYPDGWSVWRQDVAAEGGYELTYSSNRRPSGEDVDEYLTPPSVPGEEGAGANPLDGLASFIKGFQAL